MQELIYFSILLICTALLVALIDSSEKTENKFLRWTGRIFPPCLLLGLVVVPFDLFTAFIWLVAGSIMVYSSFRVASKLFLGLTVFSRSKSRDVNDLELEKLIRPLLCVSFFFVANSIVSKSVYSANAKALELALSTKEYVLKNGVCSTEKPEWAYVPPRFPRGDGPPKSFKMQYGEYGTQYLLIYRCDIEHEKFSYWVRISQDDSFSVVGRFDGSIKVTFGDYGAPKAVTLNDDIDLKELAKMKIKYKR